MSDVFSEYRACPLAEGFENSAPAWPPKRTSAPPSVLSVSSVVKFFLELAVLVLSFTSPTLRVRILLATNPVPPPIYIMRQRPRPHLPQAVELGYIFNAYNGVTHLLTESEFSGERLPQAARRAECSESINRISNYNVGF
jgi:hypothetical protein